MAYDEFLADRVRQVLKEKKTPYREQKMMGGLCFMVNDKMCIGVDTEKTTGNARIMARIGENVYDNALKQKGCSEFNITGKAMKGFVFVSGEGIDTHKDLEYWVQLCLDFNPMAKASKKK
ncbi:TfoX/Sxy family protein [Zunongwangia pacifica]|uniref:TfoX/Sxy family protein n=1 Tax=Zunongwangia pacifica TaxID=2911062 RepID=A0A9X1ZTJ5_9FLAO|nr:TfoX/Sxy family protein [Zunongwangia pacifica]MCL6218173.1 TfoX/Sxy family protein [Zunongwangia pacifica]